MADKKRAVKIFLINKNKELLLHLRDKKKGIYYPGYWCLIGGGVDEGESIFEAIKREGVLIVSDGKINGEEIIGSSHSNTVVFHTRDSNLPDIPSIVNRGLEQKIPKDKKVKRISEGELGKIFSGDPKIYPIASCFIRRGGSYLDVSFRDAFRAVDLLRIGEEIQERSHIDLYRKSNLKVKRVRFKKGRF